MQNKKKISLGFIILIFVSLSGVAVASAVAASAPEISIPSNIAAQANSTVNIPVRFTSNGSEITAMTFSIDYDQTWLEYDNTVNTISFNLPGAYAGNCDFDPLDDDGELDCSVFGFGSTIPPLTDGVFLSIELNTLDAPDDTIASVVFSDNPPVSFGDTTGTSIPGTASGGSVLFGQVPWYLPLVLKSTLPPVTPTPITPTPITPTAETPTPDTPTPETPTPETPTPPPACENIIIDWSFENQNEAWVLNPTEYQAEYTNQRSNSGDWSVITGIQDISDNIFSYSSVSQNVAIPSNIDSATLSFWHFSQSSETSQLLLPIFMQKYIFSLKPELYDWQYVIAIDPTDPDNPTWLFSTTNDNTRQWVKEVIDMSNFEGDSFILRFSTHNDGSGGVSAMFIDDVILEVCQ